MQQELLSKSNNMTPGETISIIVSTNHHHDAELGTIAVTLGKVVNSLESLKRDARAILSELKSNKVQKL